MLDQFLIDRTKFQELANNPEQIDLSNDIQFSPLKRWEIFSRVRFEYVRPFEYSRPSCSSISTSIPSLLPTMSPLEKEYGIKEYLKSGLYPDVEKIQALNNHLVNPIPDSLAYHLKEYYQDNDVEVPGAKASLFPAKYIIIHDLHHVLLGLDTSAKGELGLIAFESGMIQKTQFPILLIEQIEIFVSDLFKDIKSHELMKYWNIGANASTLVEGWDWENDLTLPLSDVREKYNIAL